MCGLAGIIAADPSLITKDKLRSMTDTIAHRGPDGEQQWINASGNAGFGHRRLAILDLSSAAIQPLHYLGRYTIIHNGEIYNYIELREALRKDGYRFVSDCDTEVIPAAYHRYGVNCCDHFDGMFAFAIWDELKQELFAARDRFGEKPFYYTSDNGQFIFASEVKAIREVDRSTTLAPAAIINFLALGQTSFKADSGRSIYQGIQELPPASWLLIHPGDREPRISRYWELSAKTHDQRNEKQILEQFDSLWRKSLNNRLRSDVAVGCSLSGGLDSSSIIAGIDNLRGANELKDKGLSSTTASTFKTFSAVFPGFEKDETAYIDLITAAFGLDNYRVTPTANGLVDDIEKLIWHQETFVSSASVYAQYCVFRKAKENGTVVLLDGQGADEILGGYHKYIHWALQELYRQPAPAFNRSLHALRTNDAPFDWSWKNKLAAYMPVQAASALNRRALGTIKNQQFITQDFLRSYQYDNDLVVKPVVKKLNDILRYDTIEYGLSSLLHYADRNSMAHGREVRLPFLNHELVSFIFSLPTEYKLRDGFTKWLLRQSMASLLPPGIVWRKDKIGYEPPQKLWMKDKHLQDQIMVSKSTLVSAGILKPEVLQKKIQPQESFAAENSDWRYLVTGLLLRH